MKAKYYIIISLVLIGCKKDPIDNDIVDKIDNTQTMIAKLATQLIT